MRTRVMSLSCSDPQVAPIHLLNNWPCLLAPTYLILSLPHCATTPFSVPEILSHASWLASFWLIL